MEPKTDKLLDDFRIISTKFNLDLIKEDECGTLLKRIVYRASN